MRWLAFALSFSVFASAVAGPRPRRVVIVSWDGAADWVVDRLLKEGKLPNVAKMASLGTAADYSTPPFPSKTAVSHVCMFTGCWPETNGVSGNSVPLMPKSDHTILETRSGFDANSHFVDPLWVTAAKAGKKVASLSAAGSYPFGPDQDRLRKAGVPLDRWVGFSGFETPLASGQMIRKTLEVAGPITSERKVAAKFRVADTEFTASVFDDPGDATVGYDSVEVATAGRKPSVLKPHTAAENLAGWSPAFRIFKGSESGNTFFRLFSLDAATGNFELFARGVNAVKGTTIQSETDRYVDAYGGFHDDPFFSYYQSGMLGKPLYAGGDGSAEERVVELVRLDCQFLKQSFRYGLKRWNPDLVFHYTPMSDSAGHTWMGLLDPQNPNHRPELAARIWPYYTKVFQLQDDWLGDMMVAAGRETAFALVADHGMAGIGKYFAVNRALQDAGLLALTADGKLDLSRTKVCAPPWGDFFVVVNTTDWKGGVVSPSEVPEVLARARKALLDARDPETGQPIVTKVFDRKEAVGMGIDGPTTGDLYLDFAPGYYPSNRVGASLVSKEDANRQAGVHGFWPQRRDMQAIFYLAGPGVASGRAPGVRVIDIAPTLCQLLGIPRPASSTGRVLFEALRR